jgi:hypothetical protein
MGTNGIITDLAGTGAAGFSGDRAGATNALLNGPAELAVDGSGNVFIADEKNNRVRQVFPGGLPALTFNNVASPNSGNYQVIVTSPYGSVTSPVVTLTVQSTNPPDAIVMSPPVIAGNNLILGFSLSPPSSALVTLLQAASVSGPWTPNTRAILTTNAQVGSFQFTLPRPDSPEFYELRSP